MAKDEGAEVELVRSVGFSGSPKEMKPGDPVVRHVRVIKGPGRGWQVECRLDMDRHFHKDTSRAPRYRFMAPDGERSFATFKGSPQSWCVQNHVDAQTFSQLNKVKEDLRQALSKRRDDMRDAGTLIDEDAEELWQRLLQARNEGVAGEALRNLHDEWAAIAVPTEAFTPEWRPPELPRVFHRKRAVATSSTGAAGPATAHAAPLRRPRDEFLRHILRSCNAAEEERGEEREEEREEERKEEREEERTEERKEEQQEEQQEEHEEEHEGERGAPKRRRAREEAEAEEWETTQEVEAGAEPASASRGVAKAGSGVSLQKLLERGPAEVEVASNTEGATAWLEVLAGALAVGGDGQGLSAKQCDAAWRHAVSLAMLGRADSQYPFAVLDLLRESLRQGISRAGALARVLTVKDALVRGGNDAQALCRAVWNFLIKCGWEIDKLGSIALRPTTASSMLVSGSTLTSLCGFAALFGDTAAVETLSKLLAAEEKWPEWQRGLAVFFGAALGGDAAAGAFLLALLRPEGKWPEDAPASGRWELWLVLASCETTGQAAIALRPPDADLSLWQEFVAAQRRSARSEGRTVLAAVAPLVPHTEGKALVSKLETTAAAQKTAQLCSMWADEAAICRKELVKHGATNPGERFKHCGALAAVVLRQWSGYGTLAHVQAAAACLAQVLLLLLSPSSSTALASTCRSLVETNFGSPLSESQWPTVQRPFEERFNSEGRGSQHFSSTGKLGHLQGKPFSEVYSTDRALVSWCVERHLESWKHPGDPLSAEPEAAGAKNPEVNRFAQFCLELFSGDRPLLHLPKPPPRLGVVGTSAEAEQELKRACHRASLACRHVFAPLLKGLIKQSSVVASHTPSAPSSSSAAASSSSAATSSEQPLPAVPKWLKAAAVAAGLRGSLLALADAHDGTGPETGEVSSAARELLAQCEGGSGSCSAGFPANAAVEQADRLEPTTRAWTFACLASDVHTIMSWLQRLGAPGEPRAAALYRLAAVAARLLRGKWPPPPACPRRAVFAGKLCFNPLRDALPRGQHQDGGLSARILALRPLSAVLAYTAPPDGAVLTSLRALEAAAGAFCPGADEEQGEFGRWAEALCGSDCVDFVLLRPWRQQTLAAPIPAATKRHLAAAVSSRCAAVHCAVVARQGPTAAAALLAWLLRDLGESDGAAILQEHHLLVKALLAGTANQEDAHLWSARHLLYRFVAVRKLSNILAGGKGVAPHPLPRLLEAAMERFNQWVKSDAFPGEETATAERLAQDVAGSFKRLDVEIESRSLMAEMVAPVPSDANGCFSGVAHVPRHDAASVLRALWAAASSKC